MSDDFQSMSAIILEKQPWIDEHRLMSFLLTLKGKEYAPAMAEALVWVLDEVKFRDYDLPTLVRNLRKKLERRVAQEVGELPERSRRSFADSCHKA